MRERINSTTTIHAADGKIAIQTHADVSQAIKQAAAARSVRTNFNPGDDHTLAISLPIPVCQQFCNERGIDMHEFLNDDALIAQCAAWAPAFKTIDKSIF